MSELSITLSWLVAFVRETAIGVVATVNEDAEPEAALVGLAVTDDGDLLFDTEIQSRKLANLRARPSVAVVVSAGDISVQVEGLAEVLDGHPRRVFAQIYESQLPGSRAMADDFALVRIRPRWLRYYDAGPNAPRVVEKTLKEIPAGNR